jgi:hypothetical protein
MTDYLDELDYCLTLPRPKTKMIPVRDEKGWHLNFIEVPYNTRATALIITKGENHG